MGLSTKDSIRAMSQRHDPLAWLKFYRKAVDSSGLGVYFANECGEYSPLFSAIRRHVPPGSRLLQVGIGPGTLAIYLSRCGYRVLGIDDSADVVALARENNQHLQGLAEYRVGSLFELTATFNGENFDAVFSAATLDHLVDGEIIRALREQFATAPLNIMTVHCNNLIPAFRGLYEDDLLLKPAYWKNAIQRAGGAPIDTFGYSFYATRLGQLNWRVPILAEGLLSRQLARFAAITGFVAKRREPRRQCGS